MFFWIPRALGELKYKQKTKTATFKNSVGFTGEGEDSVYAMLTEYHKLESEDWVVHTMIREQKMQLLHQKCLLCIKHSLLWKGSINYPIFKMKIEKLSKFLILSLKYDAYGIQFQNTGNLGYLSFSLACQLCPTTQATPEKTECSSLCQYFHYISHCFYGQCLDWVVLLKWAKRKYLCTATLGCANLGTLLLEKKAYS